MKTATIAGLLALALPSVADAQKGSWPQWRGPNRDGIEKGTKLKPTSKPEMLWMTSVGSGYTCAVIADGRLYTAGHDDRAQKDTIFCIDPETGLEIWTHTFPAQTMARMHVGGTQTTPTIEGDRLYVSHREGKAMCLDAKKGKVIWSKDLREDYDLRIPTWGFSASPLLVGDMVVLSFDRVFALDKKTGKEIWKTSESYGPSYSTPIDVKLDGEKRLAVFNGTGLVLFDLESGKELAVHKWRTRSGVNAASPIAIGSKFFISSGYGVGCAMLEAKGGSSEFDVVWQNRSMRTQMTGCVLYDGHLYGNDEGTFKCLDLEGNVKWSQRGFGRGSAFMIADGKLVMMTQRGDLVFARATPDEYEELARAKALSGGVYWSSPVVCAGRIYCRNSLGDMVCFKAGG